MKKLRIYQLQLGFGECRLQISLLPQMLTSRPLLSRNSVIIGNSKLYANMRFFDRFSSVHFDGIPTTAGKPSAQGESAKSAVLSNIENVR